MKVYDTNHIRNVALVGHQGSGKTMISEAMLFASGGIKRMGSIDEGSTVSDYHDSEHKRGMSIFSSLMHVETGDVKINLIDAPGYPDFSGEVIASLRVADTALFVLHAGDPVQVGTELAWGYAEKANLPSLFVVNHLDRSGIDFPQLVESVQERFGRSATVLQMPVGDGTRAFIDILKMKRITFPEKGKPVESDIDGSFQDRADELRNNLVENVAENDEELMEKYLEEGELSEEDLLKGLRAAIAQRLLFPITVASATNNIGVSRLMEILAELCPSPAEGNLAESESGDAIACDEGADPIAFVYRTMSEQHVGEYSFFKMVSGTIESGQDLDNPRSNTGERLGSIFVLNGRNRDSVNKMHAGDLGATVKLKATHTNDTLRLKGNDTKVSPITFPPPRYTAAIRASNAGEEDKLSTGLHKIVSEDPSLEIIHDNDMKQLLLGGQGEMHIDVAKFRLKNRFGVEVELSVPKVSYRETILKSARGQYRHKKQSGGAGQFADISMILEPLEGEYQAPADIKVRNTATVSAPWGAEVEFIDAIVSGVIDMRRFSGAIQKGVLEAMAEGPIAGYPCGNVRVIIFDGKMHSVDSNEAAFKTASRQCFRQSFEKANPVMLEPIHNLDVLVPDDYTGDVMGDLNTRRARIQGMDAEGSMQKISAFAPEVELLRYSTQLRSLTQGRGLHTSSFARYEPMPRNVQDQIIAEAEARRETASQKGN